MAKPRMLLLDEPTEGIQPSIIQEIEEVIVQTTEPRYVAPTRRDRIGRGRETRSSPLADAFFIALAVGMSRRQASPPR